MNEDVLHEILQEIQTERKRQDSLWGDEFDKKNTLNDWVAYICRYVGQAAFVPESEQRALLLKAATLCVAALEQATFSDRHYEDLYKGK